MNKYLTPKIAQFLILAFSIVAVFGQTLGFSLLWWDDHMHICQNPNYAPLSFGHLLQMWKSPFFGLYSPVAYTLWSLPVAVAQLNEMDCESSAWLFHGANILLHLLNCLLVWRLLIKLFPAKNAWLVFFGVLFFALHPLQVETVAWVSAFRDLVAAAIGFSALLFFLEDRLVLSLLFLLAAPLAKPIAVIFPLFAILICYAKRQRQSPRQKCILALAIGFNILVAVLTKNLQADSLLRVRSEIWQRPIIFLHNIGFYLWKIFIPIGLVADYERSILSIFADPTQLWPLGLACALFFLMWKYRGIFLIPGLWLLIGTLPVAGFLSFGFQETSTVADHYMYVALLALPLALISISFAVITGTALRLRLGIASLLLLALISYTQTSFWKNDESLFARNLELVPFSYVAFGNLGSFYFQHGKYELAEKNFRQALTSRDNVAAVWVGLGTSLSQLHRDAEAMQEYLKAVRAGAGSAQVLNNLATLFFKDNNYSEAEANWMKASQLDPNYFEPEYNLALLAVLQKQDAKALLHFKKAHLINPRDSYVESEMKRLQDRN